MSGWLIHHYLLLAIVAVAAVAWLRGGWPERIGASLNLGAAVAFWIGQSFSSLSGFAVGLLVIDILLGVGFLILAIRFTSLWLGGAMLLQAVQFSLHAYYLVSNRPNDRLFAIVNNVESWGVLACILAGVATTWIQRSRRTAAPAAG
jgi:hypothetical protein